jgi:hypothetical protein
MLQSTEVADLVICGRSVNLSLVGRIDARRHPISANCKAFCHTIVVR